MSVSLKSSLITKIFAGLTYLFKCFSQFIFKVFKTEKITQTCFQSRTCRNCLKQIVHSATLYSLSLSVRLIAVSRNGVSPKSFQYFPLWNLIDHFYDKFMVAGRENNFQNCQLKAVWPDDGIKSSRNVYKSCQEAAKVILTKKWCFSNQPIRSPNIWATFAINFIVKILKNRPIWSHWLKS